MGGVISSLFCMLMHNGFSVDKTAAELVYFPPSPPTYSLTYSSDIGKFEVTFRDNGQSYLTHVHRHIHELKMKPEVHMVETTMSNKIPTFCYRFVDAKYTIIYSHGNATDIGAMNSFYIELCHRLKSNVVAYDYTGYGESTGPYATELGTYADISAVFQWCLINCCGSISDTSSIKSNAKSIILFGESIGSGPTCYLACKEEVGGVILQSPILSAMRVVTDSRILGYFDLYPNIERITEIKCPVFIIHGMLDAEVNWEHGRTLYKLTPDIFKRDPYWVVDRGHSDIVDDKKHVEEFYWQINQFISKLQ